MTDIKWWFVESEGRWRRGPDISAAKAREIRRDIKPFTVIQVFEHPHEAIVCHRSFGEKTYPDLDTAKVAVELHLHDIAKGS